MHGPQTSPQTFVVPLERCLSAAVCIQRASVQRQHGRVTFQWQQSELTSDHILTHPAARWSCSVTLGSLAAIKTTSCIAL